MKSPFESRATIAAYTDITVIKFLMSKAIDLWTDVAALATAQNDQEAFYRCTHTLNEYLMTVLPKVISAKKFLGDDSWVDDQIDLDRVVAMDKDKVGLYSVEDILKEFGGK